MTDKKPILSICDHSVMMHVKLREELINCIDELLPFDCLNFDEVVHSEPQLSNQWMEFLAIYTILW